MIRGVVSRVSSNQFNNKELWSFRLNGDNNYYNTGEVKPPVLEGQSIEFDTKIGATGKHSVLLHTIKPWESDGVATPPPVSKLARPTMVDKDQFWKNKEDRDIRNDGLRELGATRNTAIEFIKMLVSTESLVLPKTVSKREEVLWEALNHYTDKLRGVTASGSANVVEKDTGEESVADSEPQSTGTWN